MAEVKKARLFLRRGTDADRKTTTLCEGELGYSTDAFRIFIGDATTAGGRSVGMTAFVSAGKNFNTNLIEASGNGLAHTGDIAVYPGDNYTNAGGGTSSIDSSHATTVMLLTGTNPATSSHWVNINKNIPFGNISVSADDITGDYVSGGNITGPITLSSGNVNIGGEGTTENLFLSGVTLSAESVPSGNIIYPLGVTSTSQVTCISSVFGFGEQSSGAGNSVGMIKAVTTATSGISAKKYGTGAPTKTVGVQTFNANGVNIFTQYLDGSHASFTNGASTKYLPDGWTTDWDTDHERINVAEILYTEGHIRNALDDQTIQWAQIEEFHFIFWGVLGEARAGFFGYYNALADSNIPLEMEVTNAKKKKINSGPNISFLTIPNTWDGTTKQLKVHIGNVPNTSAGYNLVGVKVRT